jgi:glycosyltransferase family protein
MYADNNTKAPAVRFKELRRIWAKRSCVFVEGEHTGMGVGNDLFKNAARIRRIIAPAENAFHSYDAILKECRGQPADTLFLLALGPTATVLAYDLCRLGFQAVDVGHVDLEYEWFLRGEGRRTLVEGKYNNEMPEAAYPEAIEDETYLGQIIARFC